MDGKAEKKKKKHNTKHKWHELTHRATGEEGGPSAHGVDVTLWRQTCGPTVTHVQNEPKRKAGKQSFCNVCALAGHSQMRSLLQVPSAR